jgi:hypothetical protein
MRIAFPAHKKKTEDTFNQDDPPIKTYDFLLISPAAILAFFPYPF